MIDAETVAPLHARVVIVGAGRVGLAMAYALLRRGLKPQLDFILIAGPDAREREVVDRTFSARDIALPGIPPPESLKTTMSETELINYLDSYAAQLGLEPLRKAEISGIRLDAHGHGLVVVIEGREISARSVVITDSARELSLPLAAPGIYEIHGINPGGGALRSVRLRRETARVARAIARRP